MARRNGSSNYLAFEYDKEVTVTLTEDRGRLSRNDFGEFFARNFGDGRFTCASPDLERRLLDVGARAGSVVSIRKERYGRSAVWNVKLLGASQNPANGHDNGVDHAWNDLPAEKYAPSPPDGDLVAKLAESVAMVEAAKVAPAPQHAQPIAGLAGCFVAAIDSLIVARDYAQSKGIDLRLHLEITGADLQDLAATIYIAQAKAANVALMNRNDSLRRENVRG
jgi:hypothetical protein